jgi:hypothetical protein
MSVRPSLWKLEDARRTDPIILQQTVPGMDDVVPTPRIDLEQVLKKQGVRESQPLSAAAGGRDRYARRGWPLGRPGGRRPACLSCRRSQN